MERAEGDPSRRVSALLWSVLCIVGGGAIGFAIDHFLTAKNTGSYTPIGLMLGMTSAAYLEERGKPSPKWGFRFTGLVFMWCVVLQIVLKA